MATKEDRAILSSILNPFLPFNQDEEIIPEELTDVEEESSEQIQEIQRLELEAIKASEAGDHDRSIRLFTEAIDIAPRRPATYNNRAQAYRLAGDIDGALSDLDNSIRVSEGRGRSACLAYCQRGLVHRLLIKEDQAKRDFKEAAQMGSSFARQQLVQMNSYAALCNDMLSKVLAMYKNQ